MDICNFINKLISLGRITNPFKYKVVNLACKETISNVDIAYMVKRRFDSKSNIFVKEAEPGLFRMKANRAFEMGFEPMKPSEIVNLYLDYVIETSVLD